MILSLCECKPQNSHFAILLVLWFIRKHYFPPAQEFWLLPISEGPEKGHWTPVKPGGHTAVACLKLGTSLTYLVLDVCPSQDCSVHT
jgi:hypothetical protein